MNDTECRYLIQRRFDGDLDPHEEQSLDDFIDQSESCAKFEHQLDQMIQGAEELSLPEDFAPPNPEALAKVIQQQLPQQKAGFFSAIAAMFGGGGGSATRSKGKGNKGKKSDPYTAFPHPSKRPRGQKVDMDPDDAAISQRLKSLQRSTQQEEYVDSRETQSTTSSLGQKLGFEAGPLMQEESSQLTLAESIKRKIAESQGLSTDEDHGHDPYAQDPYAQPLNNEPEAQEQWSSPTPLPGQTQPPQPSQSGQIDSPVGIMQTPAQPQRQSGIPTPHPGSSIGLAPPGQETASSDSWDTRPPKG
ncbi:MAG TPA: hypothetical protein PKD05_18665, partial [Candidatus Melainabacteria bacterium]|nr:hypothetical protein [Candidatus Melainabacteria bacterium]